MSYRNKQLGGKTKARRKGAGRNTNMRLTRSPTSRPWQTYALPSQADRQMVYTFQVEFPGVTASGSTRYAANGLFNPNAPNGGSSVIAGRTANFGLYNFCRVIKYAYDVDVINGSAQTLLAMVVNVNTDPGATATSWNVLSGSAFGQQKAVSPVGGMDRVHFRGRHTIAQIVGSGAVENDDSYNGTNAANPVDTVYLGIGFRSLTALTVAENVQIIGQLRMFVRFWDPINLTS